MESGALVQKLGSMEVQVAESREDETARGDLNNIREILAIVRSEAGDETGTVDFCVNKGSASGRGSGEMGYRRPMR